jgi:hypothetical protein
VGRAVEVQFWVCENCCKHTLSLDLGQHASKQSHWYE